MLAGGGVAAGAVLLGATPAQAANGDPFRLGRTNAASNTTAVHNTAPVPSLQVSSTHGTSGAAHGLVIVARHGYGLAATSAGNHAVSGTTSAPAKAGVIATHNGAVGTGAALIANGRKNTGAYVYNTDATKPALLVRSSRPGELGPFTEAVRVDAENGLATALTANGKVTIRARGSGTALSIDVRDRTVGAEINAFTLDAAEVPTALRLSATAVVQDPEDPTFYNGYAIDATGHAIFEGDVTCWSITTRTSDPTDPGRYLIQHSLEATERRSVVDGVATASASGLASVEVPAWFPALYEAFRYQLTPLGAAAPSLHVSNELADGRFTIAGAGANQKVSWQLTGSRKG